jgi:hypothetical protein
MPALVSDLRKTLENTVVQARELAERGARDALTALAVGASEPFASMSEEERKLRNRLRARGRQLGDQRDSQKGIQSIERLVREMAYEHWHRMLFARFLAENQLLIEPNSGVSISLVECEELAAEEGADLWGLAAQFAQEMLPEIFRTDDPVLSLRLPLEIRQQLQALVAGLDAEVFTASDSLGWTYQFWQTKRKKEVNDSGVKIGADELPPVTQLFTEDYMVDFLLDNTLGAWHAGKMLSANPELASTAQTEDVLRQAVALPGCPWTYLRFVKSDDGKWAPAAGTFDGWPKTAAELTCLDPCMGSGHFVVAMFERLVALHLADGEQMEAAAVEAVIEGNLYGLEIDPRCTQIAAFNLALAAWRRVGHCKLPAMNLACSGLAPNAREANWLAMAGDNERLRNGMERLYRLFQKASVLGSLINPRTAEGNLLVADFHELQPLLEQALAQEKSQDDTTYEMAVTARGLAKAAEILVGQFSLVATNVPYLGISKHPKEMLAFIERNYGVAKHDLATVFLERIRELLQADGVIAAVTLGEWLYLGPYLDYRTRFLGAFMPLAIVRLGWNAFSTPIRANPALIVTSRKPVENTSFGLLDGSSSRTVAANRLACLKGAIDALLPAQIKANPDSRFVNNAEVGADTPLLSAFAEARSGLHAGDLNQFFCFFWEVAEFSSTWEAIQTAVNTTAAFGGREQIVRWENEQGTLAALAESVKHLNHAAQNWRAGKPFWGRQGVVVGLMGNAACGLYSGDRYDVNSSVIIPKDESRLAAIWCYCESGEFSENVRRLDNSLKLSPQTLLKVPFDLELWQEVAAQKYPNGLPKPFSSDPTQWLFSGHPAGADQPLHVAVARLLGYRWPRQTGSSFVDCPSLDPDGLELLADNDGIVCLTPIRGEPAAADRLRILLSAAFGDEWSNAKERELLLETAVANDARKAAADLGDWLRQSYFVEHCRLFQSRPLIWQIWDGNPRGFSALVNCHKLAAPKGQGRKTLELLTFTYLGDWIDRQKLDQAEGVNGADDRLAAALDLQGQLKKILEGEPPYDIFVRWKPLHKQPIGWDPDINDGVRLNIRPFLNAQLRKGGKAGAGILRAKPGTIKWTKDRGKTPTSSKDDFPWFWGWEENTPAVATDFGAPIPGAPPAGDSFDGNRWNDLHYTRAAKEAARARHRDEG